MDTYGVLTQIFQPYFYYSIIVLVASFICIKLLTYLCPTIPPKTKSLLYLVPLMAPLFVMVGYLPSSIIRPGFLQVTSGTVTTVSSMLQATQITTVTVAALQPAGAITLSPAYFAEATITSVTGILCIVGLFAASAFGIFMVLANDHIARRILHIIPLETTEYPWLQARMAESSRKMGFASLKIGVVEDLRPNAFTIGYGKKATVVFSVGLLNILSQDEVAAVASHEVAHISNRDFFHKVLCSTLTLISFFNPVSYLASAAAQREREMLADQGALDLMEKPSVLGDALAKICRAIEIQPKEGFKASLSSNLLVSSSVLHRVSILSTHPRLDRRLRNISKPLSNTRLSRLRVGVTVSALALILVCCMLASSMFLVTMQQSGYGCLQIKTCTVNSTGYRLVSNGGIVLSMSPVVLRAVNASVVDSPALTVSPVTMGVAPVLDTGPVLLGAGSNGSVMFSQGNLTSFP